MHARPTLVADQLAVARTSSPTTSHIRVALALWMLTGALTILGVLLGHTWPALAPGGTAHPTLHGTVGEAASIFTHNARILAAPMILTAARWGRGPVTRALGDAIVAATLLINPLLVGSALGRHGAGLLVYLPHLPLEWAALSITSAAWVTSRHSNTRARTLAAYAAMALLLTATTALVETFTTPHAA